MTLLNQIRGCLLAGAMGDCLGRRFEYVNGLPVEAESPWLLSDDTQMTLATCEAIIEHGRVVPEHVAARLAAWFREERITGLGSSTLKALRDLDAGLHWALAGAKGERAAGNGAAMRIAPLAFFLNPERYDDRRTIRDVSRITHHHDEAYLGALAMIVALRCDGPDDLFARAIAALPDCRVRDRLTDLAALSVTTSIEEVARQYGASGYVVDSVPLALFAVCRFAERSAVEMFGEICLAGGDADTIASMAGQVFGAWYGTSRLSDELLDLLPDRPLIEQLASQLAPLAENAARGE